MPRPLAIVNADVWTMEPAGERAHAVLVEGARILRVGEERAVLRAANRAGARVWDARGSHVIPGIIDGHTHLVHQGLLRQRVDLDGTRTKEEALGRVRQALRGHRGRQPLLAERWDESQWRKRAWPTRQELDDLSRRVPVVLRRIDGHVAVANTAAVRQLEDKLAGVDVATGHLVEEASLNLNRVWPTPVPDCLAALRAAQALALAKGVTGVHDFVTASYLRAYQQLHRSGRLRLRVTATPYLENLGDLERAGFETGLGDVWLRLGGVKGFADGSIGGHTAALRRPYLDGPGGNGRLNHSDAAAAAAVETAARGGLQPSLHAIGDAAIDQVLAAYRRLPAGRRRRLRPRLEHFELHHPEQVALARRLGVVLSMQPNFVGTWSRKGGMYEQRLGATRARHNNEFRKILAAGATLAFGSDCMPLDPWRGLAATVGAPHRDQRLTLEQALRAYTLGAAYGIGRERQLGSLRAGKAADVVVAGGDWGTPEGIARTRVERVMTGGHWVL